MSTNKVRGSRLRQAGRWQSPTLAKARRRDPRANHYGTDMLIDARTKIVAICSQASHGMSVEAVEDELNRAATP